MSLTQEPSRRRRGRTRGLVAMASAAAAAVTATALLVIPAMADESEKFDWTSCSDVDKLFECSLFKVPLDWNRPDDDPIHLHVMRRKASVESRGTLIINPGGPGTHGDDKSIIDGFGGDIAKYFDVVGFNPRGLNNDNNIRCSASLIDTMSALKDVSIASRADFDDRKLLAKNLKDSCTTYSKPSSMIDHVDTISTVKDIEALRIAFGGGPLNFYGTSYGTLMAQQYVEMYPANVGAIVSDSNMDHSLDQAGWFSSPAQALQQAIDDFVEQCGQRDDCYPILGGKSRGDGSVRSFWNHLMNHAAREELTATQGIWTQAALVQSIADELEHGTTWKALASWMAEADGKAGSPAAPRKIWSSSNLVTSIGDHEFVTQATMCQDWNLGIRDVSQWSTLHKQAQNLAPGIPAVPKADLKASYCLGWDGAVSNPPRTFSPQNTSKILLVNSKYDGATGYNWAVSDAKQFGDKAVLLTYNGSGHGVLRRSSCTDAAISAYLLKHTMPASNACPKSAM